MMGVSSADGITATPLEVNGSGQLLTTSSGGGSITQYAEGATNSPGTGDLSLGRYLTADPTLTANQMYALRLDVNQRLMVNTAALSAANDTITAYQGGGWSVTATTNADGSLTGGAAGSKSLATGGIYNTTSPTLTNGQQAALQLDSSGNLLINGSGSTQPISVASLPLPTGAATSANQTNGSQLTQITDANSVVATNMTPGTPNSSGNAQLIAPTSQTQAFSVAAVQAGTTYDVGNYSSVKLQILTQYTGTTPTITFQTSNDGTTWVSQVLEQSTGTDTLPVASTTGTGMFYGALTGRYFRLNFTGVYSSGNATGTIVFSTLPVSQMSMGVASLAVGGAATAGTITTSASSISSTSASTLGGFALVSVHGTYAGVSFGITLSDDGGTTFYPVSIYDAQAQQWLAPGSTITPGTNASRHYWVAVAPVSNIIKVLASAYTSGTANIRIDVGFTADAPSNMSQIMDAAGNNRGANVNASNQLLVSDANLAPVGTALNTYSIHLTSNTTTTPTASTAYISSIAISNEVGGTTSSITIQDKQGTPLKLVNGIATTALTTAPTIITFPTPVKMVSGIDIITAGAVAATVDVWVNFYQ
jgi:hypothetical protein